MNANSPLALTVLHLQAQLAPQTPTVATMRSVTAVASVLFALARLTMCLPRQCTAGWMAMVLLAW